MNRSAQPPREETGFYSSWKICCCAGVSYAPVAAALRQVRGTRTSLSGAISTILGAPAPALPKPTLAVRSAFFSGISFLQVQEA
jgi:hypothetical protein